MWQPILADRFQDSRGANNRERNWRYFTAGPDQEEGGVFGYLTAAPAPEE